MQKPRFFCFVLACLLVCLTPAAAETNNNSQRPPVKPRKIIFNLDGSTAFNDTERATPGDIDKYIHSCFAGLDSRYIDAVFWMDGAGGNTANYDSQVLELTGERIGQISPQLKKWIAEGNDLPKVIVREARKRGLDVFFSFRINDTHDAFNFPTELPTFKTEHPEWTIGKGHENCAHTALNFAIPEVRDIKFRTIKEIFDKYDFDGIEIDFMRGPPFFIPGQEPENAPVLTEFLRKVRRMLDQRGNERGRPIEIAARVGENLDACRLDAFDVKTWMQDRLIDILVLGSGTIDIDIEDFKELAEGTGVLVYPCVYGWPSGYHHVGFDGKGGQGGLSPDLARGLASRFWHQGADGMYTFNWFPDQEQLHYQVELLSQIGDPRKLVGTDRMFAADRGAPKMPYPHNWMHALLPITLEKKQEVTVPVTLGSIATERPVPGILQLQVVSDPPLVGETLSIMLNGTSLPSGVVDGSRLVINLNSESIRGGRNEVKLALRDGKVTVKAIEIHVRNAD